MLNAECCLSPVETALLRCDRFYRGAYNVNYHIYYVHHTWSTPPGIIIWDAQRWTPSIHAGIKYLSTPPGRLYPVYRMLFAMLNVIRGTNT